MPTSSKNSDCNFPQPWLLIRLPLLIAATLSWTVESILAANEIPSPPPGAEAAAIAASEAAPQITTRVPANAPVISQITEITLPDETLSMSGEGLDEAKLRLWAGREVFPVEPLRADAQRLQAVVPTEVSGSPVRPGVLLVWPEKRGIVGAPIRVNAPTVWWTYPTKPNPGEEIRIMGKNLAIENAKPVVILADAAGSHSVPIAIDHASPYELRGKLPQDLPTGDYFVQAHNGTGGSVGWSERFSFEAVAAIPEPELVITINEREASSNRGLTPLLEEAIQKAVEAGGAIIELPAGHYPLEKTPVVLPAGVPIVIRGQGMGTLQDEGTPGWWHRSKNDGQPRTSLGTHRGKAGNPSLFRMVGDGSRIENVILAMVSNRAESAIEMGGRRQVLRNVRLLGASPGVWDHRLVDISGVQDADALIDHCDFVLISTAVAGTNSSGIRIANSRFLGNYVMGRGVEANALRWEGIRGLIVEDSQFRSVDRIGGRMLGRTALFQHNNCRNVLMQNNTTRDVGATPGVMGLDGNIGEQYLFHSFRQVVRDFAVVSAAETTLQPEADAMQAVHKDFFAHDGVVVFVKKGRGAGQFRAVTHRDPNGTLHLAKPWRVVPDAGSIVTIDRGFRQIAIINNEIDPSPTPEMQEIMRTGRFKTVGIFYFYNTFDTVTDGNTIRNTSSGVSIAERVGTSTGWNIVRNNTMENMLGFTGATTFAPAFISQNARSRRSNNVEFIGWLSAGNVFRSNKGSGADLAGYQGWLWQDMPGRGALVGFVPDSDNGSMLTVIENNNFGGTERGFLFSAPANWSVFRNNTIRLDSEDQAQVELLSNAPPNNLLVIPESQLEGRPGPRPTPFSTASAPAGDEEEEE